MYIDDCVDGTRLIMDERHREPVNLGSDELVTINQLVDIVEEIAGVTLERRYDLDAPQGVRGRNSDNTLIRATYGWAPSIASATAWSARTGGSSTRCARKARRNRHGCGTSR